MSKPHSSATRRVAAGLLAAALAVAGLAFAPSARATDSVANERYAGQTRWDTARRISQDEAFATPKSAIVATGLNFPDALAASTLAGTSAPAPVILTETARLTQEASEALAALKAKGVTNVSVVGGTDAVSDATFDAIKSLGLTVTRVAGVGSSANRYGTAAAIANAADAITDSGTIDGVKAAFFATGLNFPDAISVAAGAYAGRIPVLLVNSTVPAETTKAISDLGIKQAYILGGTNAVSAAVATQLGVLTGSTPVRIQGEAPYTANRFGTSAAIADFELAKLGFDKPTAAILANGTDAKGGYDALASGPLGGQLHAPVLLTASLPQSIRDWLDAHSDTIKKIYGSGGTGVIDLQTLMDAVDQAEHTDNDKPTPPTTTTTTPPAGGGGGGGGGTPPTTSTTSTTTPATVTSATASDIPGSGDDITVVFDKPVQGVGTYTVSDGQSTYGYDVESHSGSTVIVTPNSTGADFDAFDNTTYTLSVSGEKDQDGTVSNATDVSVDEGRTNAEGIEPGQTRVVSAETGRAFTTIQAAVDAEAPGGADELDAFTASGESFDERVTITESGLTIDGGSAASGRAVLHGTFVVDGAQGVTIDGFDVSQFASYQNASAAFYLNNVTGLTLSDNVVTGSGATGTDMGVVNVTGAPAEVASITGTTFTSLHQGVFANESAEFTINGYNVFDGNGVGSANDAVSVITGNTFSNNTIEAIGLGVAGSTVSGNSFGTVASGNYVCDYTPDAYNLQTVASANTFPADGYSIQENGTAPDCITPAPAPGENRVVSEDTGRVFRTIQSAVDAEDVSSGGNQLMAYTTGLNAFDELVTITKSGLTIDGHASQGGHASLHGTFVVAGANNVTIQGFNVSQFDNYQNATAAFYLDGVSNLTLGNDWVTGSGANGADKGVVNVTGGAVEQATIITSKFSLLRQGVFANPSAQFSVRGSTFSNNGVGSANDAPSAITNNRFTGNTIEGIGLGVAGSTVSGNTFEAVASGNYLCDYTPNAYDLQALASANTFPADGYSIEENGVAPDCITPAPAAGQNRVISTDTGRVFSSIQEAVDAEQVGNGADTLRAYSTAGPFTETVTVSKDGLTIDGSPTDATGRAVLHGTFVVDGASGVVIDGFDVSHLATYQSQVSAFYLNNVDNVALNHNVVTGDGGVGAGVINTYGGDGEAASMSNNTFTGLLQGVYANPSATFTITGNTFDGNVVGSANDAPSTITDNVFRNNTTEGIGLGVANPTISRNTFAGNAVHVRDYTDPDANDEGAIYSNNTFDRAVVMDEGIFSTIQGAEDVATANDVLSVYSNTAPFDETVTVDVNGLKLQGVDQPALHGTVVIAADDVTVDGLHITDFDVLPGFEARPTAVYIRNIAHGVRVTHNVIDGTAGTIGVINETQGGTGDIGFNTITGTDLGIYVNVAGNFTIRGNTIADTGAEGIAVESTAGMALIDNVFVSNNGNAVSLYAAGVTLTGNDFSADGGVLVDDPSDIYHQSSAYSLEDIMDPLARNAFPPDTSITSDPNGGRRIEAPAEGGNPV